MVDIETECQKGAYDEHKFEIAFQSVLQMEKKDYPSYIGGFKVASGNDFIVKSPIDNTIDFGHFQEPEDGITDTAVEAALKAYESWSMVEVSERVKYFEKALEMICAQRYRLASIVVLSAGMIRCEALAEVDRLIDIIQTECDRTKVLKGKSMGVWAIVTTHSSPLAAPAGFAVAAMLGGNSVIVMPSVYCPLPVYAVYEILVKAGLPDGVMNLIVDRKEKTQETLTNDPRLAGVVASGSGKILDDMMFLQVDDEISFINEIKGMNPAIVYKPSDMKKTVKDIISSAFRYSGQSIYSTSKVILFMEDDQAFMDEFIEQMKNVRVDDPADPGATMGPMISEDNFKQLNETLKKVSNCVIMGGKKVSTEFTQNGSYVSPAVLIGLDDDDDLTYMDFGFPLLYIKVVPTIDEAFEELAYTECGQSAGIFTKDQKVIEKFLKDSEVPEVFVNKCNEDLPVAASAKIDNFIR